MSVWQKRVFLIYRISLLFLFIGGVGYAALGFILEYPPKSLTSISLYVIGIFTLLTASQGYCGTHGALCCLKTFSILLAISFLTQVVFVILLHLRLDKMVEDLNKSDKDRNDIKHMLSIAKWFFLVILVDQVLVVLSMALARSYMNNSNRFESLKEPSESISIDLQKLKTRVNKANSKVEDSGERLKQKIAKKYGHLSHTVDWNEQKKNKKSWIPFK